MPNKNTNSPHRMKHNPQQQPRYNHNHHNNNNNATNPRHSNHHRPTSSSQSSPPLPTSGLPYGYVPAFLPGAASLVEQLDQKLMIVLRDGRHLVGVLRSFDQFSNMVLQDAFERKILYTNGIKLAEKTPNAYYTDIKLGLYLVRGDSMVLLGEVANDDDNQSSDNDQHSNLQDGRDSIQHDTEVQMNHNASAPESLPSSLMQKVSLVEFEKLQEQIEKKKIQANDVDELTWEFDTDLIV